MAQNPNRPKKITLTKVAYVEHPMADGLQEALNRAHYKVIDGQFAPANYEHEAKAQEVIDKFASGEPDAAGATADLGADPSNSAGKGKSTLQQAAAGDNSGETLLGSSTLAATYEIGGQTVQLGDIVVAAHKASGKTLEEWNALSDADRDGLLKNELDARLQVAGIPAAPKATAEMTDGELRDAIKASTGEAPPWNLGRDKLVERFEALPPK